MHGVEKAIDDLVAHGRPGAQKIVVWIWGRGTDNAGHLVTAQVTRMNGLGGLIYGVSDSSSGSAGRTCAP